MCGIIGIVSINLKDAALAKMTLEALKSLEYRGYDSVGMASMDSSHLEIRKSVGNVEQFERIKSPLTMKGNVFLGHTRWATHGEPNDTNAHPHSDCNGEIAVIHNGTILNFLELREDLISKGHNFKSETDTEVIPHLIEHFRKLGMDNFSAFKRAIEHIHGDHAVLAIIKGDNRIFFSKRNNPLIIGLGDEMNLISSDVWSMIQVTNRTIPIGDDEIGYITADSVYAEKLTGEKINLKSRLIVQQFDKTSASLQGYESFMMKEIRESWGAVRDTLTGLLKENELLNKTIKAIERAKRVIIVAAGTSYNAGLLFTIRLQRAGFNAISVIASEHNNLRTNQDDTVLVISQSGETMDSLIALKKYKNNGSFIISLTNTLGNSISSYSDIALHTRAGPEIGVAATKTFTSQVGALMLLSSLLLNESVDYLKEAESVIANSFSKVIGYTKIIGSELSKKPSLYYLGKGLGVPLAMEGALKIKEIAYVHAEAYPAGESKHGPIALVENGFPVIFLNNGEFTDELYNNVMEMESRHAKTYVISAGSKISTNNNQNEIVLDVPDPRLSPLALAPPIQLIAYYAAKERGANPDRPRNLAKTVTVR
ncbi:glutamine--fructose-6-phosphate transaminase (isomerizing) [Metallosphaera tengchongensis]|uniref:glutamine--fructose-6-phosphate transaminase (isomerizing) n=1 Tax=Metallosphaera tengchongensis TaxID=1532350 RepID=A0A6N0NR96_9CREN|nr:glutamine--fructose-6-phosphate transaminase (isomerizing) [Metallosphaera tengchongensis]QKQ99265.1 glutamine--fructose-6-phosphate transaminase (isomerizing) [Metallosphaera tengchongensis]